MNLIRRIGCALLGMLLLLSCEKEGRTIYIAIDEDDEIRDMVFFVSKKGSLGDSGYVDAIYRGVVRGANSCNLMVASLELPTDGDNTIDIIEAMLDFMQNEQKDRKALVVIANDNLEPLLHEYESMLTKAPNVDFLLCESDDTTLPVYTLRLPQYGVYYQAGMLAKELMSGTGMVKIVNANSGETELADMGKGFTRAIEDSGAEIAVDNAWLSEDSGGYDQAGLTYQMSYEIDKTYDMVIPLCGGSAQGFYRYNRENPESFYTLGVDTDMQLYSERVPFSIVKHLDDVLEDWISDWWSGEQTPARHQDLGLASGRTEIVISDLFMDQLDGLADKYYDAAVKMEEEYEKQ